MKSLDEMSIREQEKTIGIIGRDLSKILNTKTNFIVILFEENILYVTDVTRSKAITALEKAKDVIDFERALKGDK